MRFAGGLILLFGALPLQPLAREEPGQKDRGSVKRDIDNVENMFHSAGLAPFFKFFQPLPFRALAIFKTEYKKGGCKQDHVADIQLSEDLIDDDHGQGHYDKKNQVKPGFERHRLTVIDPVQLRDPLSLSFSPRFESEIKKDRAHGQHRDRVQKIMSDLRIIVHWVTLSDFRGL